nr:hypothetical protein [Tanacetum cinerariifolium]
MALTFADTHNMIAYLTKSDASEGFDQIIDFLNTSSIKYALTVNTNIYVSCIKQLWSSVLVKKVNDVMRLQALVDKKKVIITEATIRDALRLNDADSIDCLPNEEIFTKLSRMGYKKPSTKLTFYKAFFSPQWKFLTHTILQYMSAKRTSWNEFSSSMASAVICLSTGRKFNFSKYVFDSLYSSPALAQKVFTNIRRVGKGFSGVDIPLFEGMIVTQLDDDATDEGAASVVVDDVHAAADTPSIPSPTPTTPPPPPSQNLPFTSHVQPTPLPSPIAQPPSPQQQPQPLQSSHDAKILIDLLQTLLETCTTLTRRVKHLEQDKIAQTLKITKLKQRIKKLEKRNKLKVSKLRRLKRVETAQRVDTSNDTVMDDGRQAESQAQIYQIDLKHADKVLSMQDDEIEPAELKEVVEVVTTAKLMTVVVTAASATITTDALLIHAATITAAPSAARRIKGAIIRDPEETATPSTIIHSEPKSKDKGKRIMVEEPKPLKKQAQIEQDKAYARELKAELNKNINWDDMIDQVQRNEKEDNVMMRMDYFKGMSYDDIRLIFEKKFNSNVAFLEKIREQMEEEDSKALKRTSESQVDKAAKKQRLDEEVEELKRHLQIVPNDDDGVYNKATPLAHKVPVVDYEIYTENNKTYYKIIRVDRSLQLFLSFLSLLRNFNREELEKKQKSRKLKKKDTELPQTSVPTSVADEAVNKKMNDSLERTATTATSLDAEQDRGFNTPQSGKDSLKINELMKLCTNLQNMVLDLETTKTSQALEIESLNKKVKKLEKKQRSRTHNLKRLYKVGLSARVKSSEDKELGEEDASKQGSIADIDSNEDIYLVNVHKDKDIFVVNDLDGDEVTVKDIEMLFDVADDLRGEDVFVAQQDENVVEKEVDVAQAKAKGIVFHEPEESTTTIITAVIPSQVKDKGNGKMVKPEPVKKFLKKDQLKLDEEHAFKLQAEEKEEERIVREKEEQDELPDAIKVKLFMEPLEKRRKFFAAKRAEEKRNRPPTRAQQRTIMSTYLKNIDGWKLKSLKKKSFAEIQELFNNAIKKVNTFVDFKIKLLEESSKKAEAEITQEGSSKRAGDEIKQERSKKQKVEDDKESKELKKCLEIIPGDGDDVTIDATSLSFNKMLKILIEKIWKFFGDWLKIDLRRNNLRKDMYLNEVFGSILLVINEAFNEETCILKKNIKFRWRIIRIKSLHEVTIIKVHVNAAKLNLVLLSNLGEKYAK